MVLGTTHDGGARQASRLAALVAALSAGLAMGCPFERGVSCGDGWWDPEYEECDPIDPLRSHVGACEARGYSLTPETQCDPDTCTILDSDEDCNQCGDGKVAGGEECDGNNLAGATCSNGDTMGLECSDSCKLDYSGCPQMCGDGFVSDFEECDPALSCGHDDDCPDEFVCYAPYGQCVRAGENFAPNLACAFYPSKVIGDRDKPYTSGTIERCTDECFFGRNNCGFCGDGELDGAYTDLVWPGGEAVPFAAEVCDGEEADPDKLHDHCRPLCTSEALNGDVLLGCNFECNAGCNDFAEVNDIANPEGLNCCLAAGSPCVTDEEEAANFPGVPNLPCCSWLDNPTWLAERRCVPRTTTPPNISYMCPD